MMKKGKCIITNYSSMSNNNLTPKQIQIIQSICSGKFSNRDERLGFYKKELRRKIDSTIDLTEAEYEYLIDLLTGIDNRYFASFDKLNKRHMKILSLCRELDWVDPIKNKVDTQRLGSWIKSKRCPVSGVRLIKMTNPEISKVIKALENMVKSKWK